MKKRKSIDSKQNLLKKNKKNRKIKKKKTEKFSTMALSILESPLNAVYESPLKHFYHNSALAQNTALRNNSSQSSSKNGKSQLTPNAKSSKSRTPVKQTILNRKFINPINLASKQTCSKRKENPVTPEKSLKRPRNSFNSSEKCDDDSIIVIEDVLLPNKIIDEFNTPHSNKTFIDKPQTKTPNAESVPPVAPVRVLHEVDGDFMVVEDHNGDNTQTKSKVQTETIETPKNSTNSDSIIIIDEDSPVKTAKPKLQKRQSDECLVVWASEPTKLSKNNSKNTLKLSQKKSPKQTKRALLKQKISPNKRSQEFKRNALRRQSDYIHGTNENIPKKGTPREIVIDGSNCAMAYTNGKAFSEQGIQLLIDYFTKRGHKMKIFVPQHKRCKSFPMLEKWHLDGILVFTPSRKAGNKRIVPYDDRYILEYAKNCDGIVVSQDQYRDLYDEEPAFRDTIENRILVPTYVNGYVMFPNDPLGRHGPKLSEFLKH
ncbi:NEDD4-binding protein 1-like [Trichogramma pretiosum]|uniref:NEDD4-binding protein 1-like n=1 Tax=Trichogramma pretiosum TaxID=7493 RepID=UPI0006C9D149|nr:NEDD4-binding protein 1-like [Trichogramma pretiosum]